MTVGLANSPTQIVPNMPQTRWTQRAPTGSSSRSLSNISTLKTTSAPAAVPMIAAPATVTTAHPAVMPTSPARQPLRIIDRSGLPSTIQATIVAETAPNAAAVLVVTAM